MSMHMHSSRDMFIRYQGEAHGEIELQGRIKAMEISPFRKWGRYAYAMRLSGFLHWSARPTDNMHMRKNHIIHLVANLGA